MKPIKLAIIGSRGIPAKYGGAETFAEELSKRLKMKGFDVFVTCETNSFKEDLYNGIHRIHTPSLICMGITVSSLNDIISTLYIIIKHRSEIDLYYFLNTGGSFAAIFPKLFGKKVLINTDGLEWKRSIKRKQFYPVYWALLFYLHHILALFLERLAVNLSDVITADSKTIKKYLEYTYGAKNIVFIAYGARKLINNVNEDIEENTLEKYGLEKNNYYLTVARIVAENNIHMEIEGFKNAKTMKSLTVVGNFNEKDSYTKMLYSMRNDVNNIRFLDPIYDKTELGIIRKNCFAYIHAYEVGGTNPSLLEQMSFEKPILAYDVPFHREVLRSGGIYFSSDEDITDKIELLENGVFDLQNKGQIQINRIKEYYNWLNISTQYAKLFKRILHAHSKYWFK